MACHDHHSQTNDSHACHGGNHGRPDWLLWGTLIVVALAYSLHLLAEPMLANTPVLAEFSHSVFDLANKMWWGVVLGIFFVGLLSKVPRNFVMKILGKGGSATGIVRACLAGVMLDLCSHGILLVGMKLYERGATVGQVMAFLIASPWNSLSLTFIMIALMGIKWTLVFMGLSMLIAIFSGLLFERLTARGVLPHNPNHEDLPEDFRFFAEAKKQLSATKWRSALLWEMVRNGANESKMVLRWVFLGVVLAALLRSMVSAEDFASYFSASFAGLGLTIIAATIIEVCSEGSTPIAADLLTRAQAPGNSFAFLMTGVSTDYTEIMGLRETTKSWKIALFLPLVTLPQVIMLGWVLNQFAGG
jgi:uncharacterized membrane protein YraQ (UPF0718 family)